MNGRHYQLTFMLTMQYSLGISPELRSNFDYIFLLGDDFISNQKRLFDHYAGMFPTLKSFREVFSALTKDYGCMVIVNAGNPAEFVDKIFWYKAGNDEIDHMGCSQFNKFHNDNYNSDWNKPGNKEFDEQQYFADKKRLINVSKISKLDVNEGID